MTNVLADQIRQNMQQKPTEELLALWVANDREQWSDTAFDVIGSILAERGTNIPHQADPVAPKPSSWSIWDGGFSVVLIVLLAKFLPFLGLGGLIPLLICYGLILLLYFCASRAIRLLRRHLLARR